MKSAYDTIAVMINFCIFEDNKHTQLRPLTESRPVYSTLIGMNTLFDKFYNAFNFGNITLHCRPSLKPLVKQEYPNFPVNNINSGSPCLFFNGRVLLNEDIFSEIDSIDNHVNTLLTYKNTLVAAFVKGDLLNIMIHLLADPLNNSDAIKQIRSECITKELTNVDLIEYPWDIFKYNEAYIRSEYLQGNRLGIIKGELKPFTIIYNEPQVFIDEHANIEDFVVINAEEGPVYIEKNVTIQAHSRLEGPLYIGHNTTILGGKISNTTIGHHCKICGEVSNSIIQPYTNKAHAGYLGTSYLGQWVNLGANTTTSNLKNNYSSISVNVNNKVKDTHMQFLGSIIGDHVKTAVGTMLNSGSIIHFGATLFDHVFFDKLYPPFSWGNPQNKTYYDFEKFLTMCSTVMERRNLILTPAQKDTYRLLYNHYCLS